MLVHFVGQQDRYQLGNTGKDQVSMEGLFVLCFPSGRAKRLFNMIDGTFYGCPYLIRGFPFRGPAQRSGISAQFLLRISIDHPSAGGIRAGVFTLALPLVFSGPGIFYPFYFGTRKLIPYDPAAQFTGSLRFHGKGRVMGTAGNSVIIQSIIFIFKFSPGIQRDKSLFKMEAAASSICSESISGEQVFVNFYRVKGGVPKKNLRTDQRMRPEKILECGKQEPGIMDRLIFIWGI